MRRVSLRTVIEPAVYAINYLEGTRFTPEKHAQQQSPYKNLLKPKAAVWHGLEYSGR